MSVLDLELAEKAAAILAITGEFLFLGYPLLRKYLKNRDFSSRLFCSYVFSAASMIIVLWGVYAFSRTIAPLVATSIFLAVGGIIGGTLFSYDLAKRARLLSKEGWAYLLLFSFACFITLVSAVTLAFTAQGDAYGYYVPLGRYLNQNPGAFVTSYYRFSLSRNFGYYAVYAHAALLGGSLSNYLFLPLPFLFGTILGVISLSKKLSRNNLVPILAATCYVFSIFLGLILRYNMYYLGNLFMATMALYFSFILLAGARSRLEGAIVPIATFSMLLLYDFSLLLLIPLALGYVAYRKPRFVFYTVAVLALPLSVVLLLQNVPLGFAQIQQLDPSSFVAFIGLVVVVLAGVRNKNTAPPDPLQISYATVLAFIAAVLSITVQRLTNLINYGFMSVDSYTLSAPVIAYMQRGYWGYQTPPDIPLTLISLFSSDVFFGWGLLFTTYGLFLKRGQPVTTFFLTLLPLTVLVETVNDNYFRFAIFLAPLIISFLAVGLYALVRRRALVVAFSLSLVALIVKVNTTLPDVDYEHRATVSPFNITIVASAILLMGILRYSQRYQGLKSTLAVFASKTRSLVVRAGPLVSKFSVLGSVDKWQIAAIIILALVAPAFSYSVLGPQHFEQVNVTDIDAAFVDQHVLPLVQAPSTILMVELIHPNFNFYKDVVVIQMAQPWILESFLRLHIANVTALAMWLSSSKIRYVFVDRGLTQGNEDVFGLFDQLTFSCQNPSCTPLYNDGRFVLVEIAA